MSYEITVRKTRKESSPEWKPLYSDAAFEKIRQENKTAQQMGRVDIEREVKDEVYNQRLDELDVAALVRFINAVVAP